MAIDKLGLYNDACRIAGAERLASLTEAREARYKLDEIFDLGAIDYCLKIAMPAFARKTAELTNSGASTSPEFAATHTLPSDFLTHLPRQDGLPSLYSDATLDTPVGRMLRDGDVLYSDHATVYLRYVFSNDTYSTWEPEFVRLFTAYLGMELAERIAPHRYTSAKEKFDALAEEARSLAGLQEPLGGRTPVSNVELTEDWLPIYNDAAQILGRPHFSSIDAATELKVMFDVARDARIVEALLEEANWNFPISSAKLEENTRLEPEWGYRYVHEKPKDLHRLDGYFHDEMMRKSLRNYQDEAHNIYTNVTPIYVKFISADYIHNLAMWPAYFRRTVSARMAYDVRRDERLALTADKRAEIEMEYEDRLNAAKNIDAMQSPPIVISQGSWSASRYMGGHSGRPGDDYY